MPISSETLDELLQPVCAIANLRPQEDWPEEVRGLVGWARQVKKKFGFEVVSSDDLDWAALAETGEIKKLENL